MRPRKYRIESGYSADDVQPTGGVAIDSLPSPARSLRLECPDREDRPFAASRHVHVLVERPSCIRGCRCTEHQICPAASHRPRKFASLTRRVGVPDPFFSTAGMNGTTCPRRGGRIDASCGIASSSCLVIAEEGASSVASFIFATSIPRCGKTFWVTPRASPSAFCCGPWRYSASGKKLEK